MTEEEKYYEMIEKEIDDEKTTLPKSFDDEEKDRSIKIFFLDEVPGRYVVMMRDNIEEFAQELGVDIRIEID
jgi:hypothetical protein